MNDAYAATTPEREALTELVTAQREWQTVHTRETMERLEKAWFDAEQLLKAEQSHAANVYVVFSYGDPMPMCACATGELAEAYAEALGRLPKNHPLYTESACVDELPLNSELPEPLRDPEAQVWNG